MSSEANYAFGVHFYTGSKAALLELIKDGIRQPYSYVVTPNVDHLPQLQRNDALRQAYDNARLRVCDSRILLPMLRSLGVEVPEVITGSDLTVDLLKWADRERLTLVQIGATEHECGLLRKLYPGITIYHHNPPMGFIRNPEEVQRCIDFVVQHPSDLVFFAVGTPQGEIVASMVPSHERTGMAFCIGASISFATGTIRRAPVWMQRAKLEWLYRMLREPRRLARRYWNDALYIGPAYLRERSYRQQRVKPAKQDS